MIPVGLYIGLGAAALGALGGWTVRDWKADSDALSAVQDAQKREDGVRAAIWDRADRRERDREAGANRLAADHTTIREIYRNAPPVPANCAVPDAVVGLLDRAVASANAAAVGESGPPMPAATAAPGPADRP